jgi:tRNA-uridine 2-sulfurtransferase
VTAPRPPVVVAMSGGVDSSVAAALLVREGYDVTGVTLRLRPCGEGVDPGSCCGVDGIETARKVAARLGIPHEVFGVGVDFQERVLRPAWEDYAAGRTPNPCIRCNRDVKFDLLVQYAMALGAPQVATGHYARRGQSPDGAPVLRRGLDPGKDQSYFLFALGREGLARALFPLGALPKSEVRAMARELGLESADRPDSQDACLDCEEGFAEALRRAVGGEARPGALVDGEGRVLGRHEGIHRFTVGQRQGTGVAVGRRAWVRRIDAVDGTVVLTTDPADLLASSLEASGATWLCDPPAAPLHCAVQVRYRSPAAAAVVTPLHGDRFRVDFDGPARALSPGQAAVIYDGDRVLGGGFIDRAS